MNVKSLFNFSEFAKIASRDEEDFGSFGTTIKQGSGEGTTYTFKDNGSEVLGVAHLDTVQGSNYSSIIRVGKERVLLSPRLDDRLGVYIITRLLPRLGITCDWLLTTGEEVGCSSAELFKPEKQYKWAFSFDRAGTDVVLYHYDHKALRRLLRKAGFKVGQGTFSDLSFIELGCSGINFGCGYQDAHSVHAYAFLSDIAHMVKLFMQFWRKHWNVALPYDPSSYSWSGYRSYRSDAAIWPYGSNGGYPSWRNGYPDGRHVGECLDWYEMDKYGNDWRYRDSDNGSVDLEQLADDAQQGENGETVDWEARRRDDGR